MKKKEFIGKGNLLGDNNETLQLEEWNKKWRWWKKGNLQKVRSERERKGYDLGMAFWKLFKVTVTKDI